MEKNYKKPRVEKRLRVYPDELLEWVGRSPRSDVLTRLGITPREYQQWLQASKGTWISAAQYYLIRFTHRQHLADLLGKAWEDFFIAGDKIEVPGLKYPLSASDLRGLWLHTQKISALSAQLGQATRENERLTETLEEAEKRARFYRDQLVLEARFGWMLNRITAS